MPTKLLMPALSPSMTEGTLVKWQKKEGERIFTGDVIAEIETDKAVIEFQAVAEGVLGKILVAEGTEGVKVDQPIALLLAPGDTPSISAETMATAKSGKELSTAAPAGNADQAQSTAAVAAPGNRPVASPLARRMAEQYGLDLSKIRGSGPGGRIGKEDVEAAREKAAAGQGDASPSAPATAAPAQTPSYGPKFHQVPISATRRVIAKRLCESKQQIPHFYLTIDCQIDALMKLRAEMNALSGKSKLSVNDFVVRAAALALRQVPAANASWTDAAILQYDEVDISVAVTAPGGLITPIIRQADLKDLHQISDEMRELAHRAKEGKLKPEEFQGGGFTISNLGMYGVRQFAAIINPPQGCILAVGSGEPRAIVKDGQLAVASVMTCTLSVDHRVVDGAVGAEFLQAFKSLIENPPGMLPGRLAEGQ